MLVFPISFGRSDNFMVEPTDNSFAFFYYLQIGVFLEHSLQAIFRLVRSETQKSCFFSSESLTSATRRRSLVLSIEPWNFLATGKFETFACFSNSRRRWNSFIVGSTGRSPECRIIQASVGYRFAEIRCRSNYGRTARSQNSERVLISAWQKKWFFFHFSFNRSIKEPLAESLRFGVR